MAPRSETTGAGVGWGTRAGTMRRRGDRRFARDSESVGRGVEAEASQTARLEPKASRRMVEWIPSEPMWRSPDQQVRR